MGWILLITRLSTLLAPLTSVATRHQWGYAYGHSAVRALAGIGLNIPVARA